MVSHSCIYDLPPKILGTIFRDLSNDELLSLPTNLLTKGLQASTARARFQYLHFGTNTDSLERLWRLSRYPSAADVVRTLVIHTIRVQECGLGYFLKLQWERHLEDYRWRRPMPKCVTMDDAHKAVGVKNWRSCSTCAGLSPRQQLNGFTRFMKANDDSSKTAESVFVYAFRLLLANEITAIRIEEHDYFDRIVAYEVIQKENSSRRTDRLTINNESLPPALRTALETSGLLITPRATTHQPKV